MVHRAQVPVITLLCLCAALFSSCGMKKAVPDAKAAVAVFHTQFNGGKFKEIYDASGAEMKKASSEADFIKFMEAVQRKLGKETSTSAAGWRVDSFNFTTNVVLTMNTTFEHGTGTETFTYVATKSGCMLKGYNIQSKDMMMK